jgi:NOL1/NOP2/sun family putative RNA methylase
MNSISLPSNFPKLLLKRLEQFFPDQYESILMWFASERIPSFRVNTLLSDVETLTRLGNTLGFTFTPASWIEGAYTLSKEDEYRFKGTPLFRNGHVYMQSISSLLPVIALDPQKNTKVLDVCAAPGSKTTQLSALMDNTGEIVAIEQNQIRMDKLHHNIRLQGAKNIRTEKIDAIKYLAESPDMFDAIILDVPCSAEGRMQFSNERSYGYFSLKNIEEKAKIQSSMLQSSFDHLVSGWKLVYSTCTLAPEENEGVITDFLAKNPSASVLPIIFEKLSVPVFPGIKTDGKVEFHPDLSKAVRFYPSELTEGFFICLITKN